MSLTETQPSSHPISLWLNTDYVLLLGGQFVSTLGSGISGLAFPLLVLALTHSPAAAGIVGFVFGFPYVIVSLPAGALVDRWDRKRVMILCDSIRAVNISSIPIAAAIGHLSVALLFIAAAVEGTAFVFFNIAEVACLPRVVSKEQLPQATGFNQAGQVASGVISAPLGGLIFQVVGRTVPFVFDAVSYLVSVLSLRFMRVDFQEERVAQRRSLLVEIREGLAWLWRHQLIRYMSFLTGGLNLVASASFLVIIVLARGLHASPTVIGILFAIGAAGGVLGSLIGPWFQKHFSYARVIIACVWLQTVLWPLYAVAPNPLILGLVEAGIVVAAPIYNVVQFSYRMALIPDALQGRVNSTVRLIAYGFAPFGAVASGILIEWVGATTSVFILSGLMLLMALSVSLNAHVRHAAPLTAL